MSTSNNKKIGSLEIGAPREMRLSSHRCPFKTEILDQQRNFEIDCNKQKNQTTTNKKKNECRSCVHVLWCCKPNARIKHSFEMHNE